MREWRENLEKGDGVYIYRNTLVIKKLLQWPRGSFFLVSFFFFNTLGQSLKRAIA